MAQSHCLLWGHAGNGNAITGRYPSVIQYRVVFHSRGHWLYSTAGAIDYIPQQGPLTIFHSRGHWLYSTAGTIDYIPQQGPLTIFHSRDHWLYSTAGTIDYIPQQGPLTIFHSRDHWLYSTTGTIDYTPQQGPLTIFHSRDNWLYSYYIIIWLVGQTSKQQNVFSRENDRTHLLLNKTLLVTPTGSHL